MNAAEAPSTLAEVFEAVFRADRAAGERLAEGMRVICTAADVAGAASDQVLFEVHAETLRMANRRQLDLNEAAVREVSDEVEVAGWWAAQRVTGGQYASATEAAALLAGLEDLLALEADHRDDITGGSS